MAWFHSRGGIHHRPQNHQEKGYFTACSTCKDAAYVPRAKHNAQREGVHDLASRMAWFHSRGGIHHRPQNHPEKGYFIACSTCKDVAYVPRAKTTHSAKVCTIWHRAWHGSIQEGAFITIPKTTQKRATSQLAALLRMLRTFPRRKQRAARSCARSGIAHGKVPFKGGRSSPSPKPPRKERPHNLQHF